MGGQPRREKVAAAVRIRLRGAGFSEGELAARAGIEQARLRALLAGEGAFDVDEIEAVAGVLGVDSALLFRG